MKPTPGLHAELPGPFGWLIAAPTHATCNATQELAATESALQVANGAAVASMAALQDQVAALHEEARRAWAAAEATEQHWQAALKVTGWAWPRTRTSVPQSWAVLDRLDAVRCSSACCAPSRCP